MTLEEQVAALAAEIAALKGNAPGRIPFVAGVVTPPSDLMPAVMALSPRAFERLQGLCAGRAVTPADLVFVSDWDREAA